MGGGGVAIVKGRQEAKCAYSVHIGQTHLPSEEPSDLPVTEVEVTVRWTSQPPPCPELVAATTFSEHSSSPSSSALRVRSITSPLTVSSSSFGPPGRWKNPM